MATTLGTLGKLRVPLVAYAEVDLNCEAAPDVATEVGYPPLLTLIGKPGARIVVQTEDGAELFTVWAGGR